MTGSARKADARRVVRDRRAAAGPLRPGRIEGLDLWRALLPLLGVVLHVDGLFLLEGGFGETLGLANILIHAFRMEAFFMIAGFLASDRLRRPSYLADRTRTLLVPLAAMWLLIALWRPSDATGLFVGLTSHLWFLLCLLQLSAAGVLGERLGVWDRLAAATSGDRRRASALFFVAACAFAAGFQHAFSYDWARFSVAFTFVQSLYYSAYFGGGVVLARSPAALDTLRRPMVCAAALVALIALATLATLRPELAAGQGRPGVATLVMTAVALCCSAAIIGSGLRMRGGAAWRWSAGAGYSVYLIHFPLVTLLHERTEGLAAGPRWLLMVASVTLGSFAAHAVVERFAPLRSLLNGADWGWLDPPPAYWAATRPRPLFPPVIALGRPDRRGGVAPGRIDEAPSRRERKR